MVRHIQSRSMPRGRPVVRNRSGPARRSRASGSGGATGLESPGHVRTPRPCRLSGRSSGLQGAASISGPTPVRIRVLSRLPAPAQCVRGPAQQWRRSSRIATTRGLGRNRRRGGEGLPVARTEHRSGDNRFVPRRVDAQARGARLQNSAQASALAYATLPRYATGCSVWVPR